MVKTKRKPIFAGMDGLRLLKIILLSAVTITLVVYFWVVFQRIGYPYELEWIEGGMLDQVERLVHGQALYVEPGIEFVPFLYPPVYFVLSAAMTGLVGGGFLPLRLVSILASLVSMFAIFLIVKSESGEGDADQTAWPAILAVGLFVACYRATGAWLDVGRVDSLFLAVTLLVVLIIHKERKWPAFILAGVLAALAFLTKQTALIVCLPMVAFLFLRNWRQGLAFGVSALLVVAIVTLVLDWRSGGWFSFYVFDLLSQQTEWLPEKFFSFWKDDLLAVLPMACLLAIFYFITTFKQERPSFWKWLLIFVGALAGTFFTRVKIGGFNNVLLPAYAVMAILFGLGVSKVLKARQRMAGSDGRKVEVILLAACLIQFLILSYNPFAQIPSEADRLEGDRLVAYLAGVEGEVFIPDHGYLVELAGKSGSAHHSAIWDVLRSDEENDVKELLINELEEVIRFERFALILLDTGEKSCCPGIGEAYFEGVGFIYNDDTSFFPLTGYERRPTHLFFPNRLK